VATLTERLAILITGEAVSAVNAFKEVGSASEGAAEKMSLSQRASGALGSEFGKLTSAAVAAGGIAAAGLAVDKVVSAFADATGQVRSFQRVSGATAEDSSRLVAAFHVLGVDSDSAGTAMFRLAHNLDGSKDALSKYGVEIARSKGGSIDLTNTLLNVADAVSKVGPGAQADAIAFAAFGRQATTLLPVLLRGRDGLKELFDAAQAHGEVFNQDDLDKGKAFSLATKDLGQAVQGLEIQLGEGLVPALTSATKGLDGFITSANKATGPIGGIGGAVEGVLKAGQGFAPIQSILDALHGDFGKIAGDLPILGTGIDLVHGHFRQALGSIIPLLGEHKKSTKDAADATGDLADAAKGAAGATAAEDAATKAAQKAIDDFTKATDDAAKAHDNLDKAHRSVTTAQRGESQAREDLNKLQQQGAVDANAVAQAEKGVASAAKATSDAQKAEAQAAQRVADAQQGVLDAETELEKVRQGASPEDIAKAQLAASKAKRDHERSTIDLADAQDKQNTIVTTGIVAAGQQVGTARDQERAALDLADATEAVQASDFAAKDAQEALTKIQQQGKDGSDDLKKAQADLKKAQDDLNGSIQAQADAHQAVIDKQQAEVEAGRRAQKGAGW
jgi:hypothetical protein